MSKHTLYQISTFALIAVLVGLFVYGTKREDVKITKAQTPAPNETLRYMMEMMDISLKSGSSGEYTGNEFIDLNGDGLADFLYYSTITSPLSSNRNGLYRVYKNNGNNTYTKIYDCSWYTEYYSNPRRTIASGDCAHLATSVSGKSEVPQFFSSYTSWPSSRNVNYSNDITYQMLNDMVLRALNQNIYGWERASRFIDINSDGLVDVVYRQFSGRMITEGGNEQQYAILLNKGDFTFTPAYKCFGYSDITNQMIYYGDCIQP